MNTTVKTDVGGQIKQESLHLQYIGHPCVSQPGLGQCQVLFFFFFSSNYMGGINNTGPAVFSITELISMQIS